MWNRISNLILRNRFIILGIHALLTVLFGYYAITGLHIDNKYGNMLPKDSAVQKTYLQFKERFGEDGSSLVIAIKDNKLYTEKQFAEWKNLGEKILKLKGVNSVISEAKLLSLNIDTVKKSFVAKPIFSDINFKEKSIEKIQKEILRNPLYDGMLYNKKTNVHLMLVSIQEEYLLDKTKQKVVLEIEKLAEENEKAFGKVHFAGLPHMRVLIGKRIMNEMYVFIFLSLFATSLIMYFFFRSFRITTICILVVIVTVIWAMGTIGMLGYSVSIMMALIPPLMIVIGIPNCIYLYNKYHQEFRLHGNKAKALSRVIRKTGTAMWLTNVTTALGFITFCFTSSDKFFQFGVIATLNIMLCYVVSLCLVPIFASFSKNPPARHLRHLDRKLAIGLMEKLVHFTAKRRPLIYIITILLTVSTGAGIYFIKVSGNLTGDLPDSDPIKKDITFIQNNFHGAVPFEIMVSYKEKGRLFGNSTVEKVEAVQEILKEDTLFSKSLSIVDFVKAINMAYYNNDPEQYKTIEKRDKLEIKAYFENFALNNSSSAFSLNELVDTNRNILRIRTQMRDLGSFEVSDHVRQLKVRIDETLNPDKKEIERLYAKAKTGKIAFYDSLLFSYSQVFNGVTAVISKGNPSLQDAFDLDPELIKKYYSKPNFKNQVRKAIDHEYYDIELTGTSVVASEGTQYLIDNLLSSIIFAVISIALLMCVLFYSFRMVLVSMIPNLIPMVVTAGVMGWYGIPLKPSNLLIFSIALGITVDNTIHFLARYRQELKLKKWDLKECVAISIRETGLSIIYTSVILFFGFIVFIFSDFGGTQALGYLSALTYFVALFTNLVLLPALLLSYDRKLTTKSFEEPMFEIYDEESDIDWNLLEVENSDIISDSQSEEK